jgi:putative ABC transport system permease protein
MVRWESVIIAVFGTIGGLALGDAFGWSLVHGLGRDQNVLFRIPVGASILIVAAGVVIGILAAARPARRAANLDVLDAIAFE